MFFRANSLAIAIFLQLIQVAATSEATPVHSENLALHDEQQAAVKSDDLLLPAATSLLTPSATALTAPPGQTATFRQVKQPLPPAPSSPTEAFVHNEAQDSTPLLAKSNGENSPSVQLDPLTRKLRSIVNMNGQQNAAWPPLASSRDVDEIPIDIGEGGRAAILQVQQALAEAVGMALNPHADEEGRIVFSIAGIDGFHLFTSGRSWSLSLGDTVLTSFSTRAPEEGPGAYSPNSRTALNTDSSIKNQVLANDAQVGLVRGEPMTITGLAMEFLSYPLTWVFIVVFIMAKIVTKLLSAPATKHRSRWRATRKRKTQRVSSVQPQPGTPLASGNRSKPAAAKTESTACAS